jgi:hypothetical protein
MFAPYPIPLLITSVNKVELVGGGSALNEDDDYDNDARR